MVKACAIWVGKLEQGVICWRPAATPCFGNNGSENPPPPTTPETTIRLAQTTANDPYLAVHLLYPVFNPTAAQQFAEHFNAQDRPAAITQLNTQVTSAVTYAMAGQRSPDVYPDDTMTISSCEIKPEGGSPLGRFILHCTGGKWYISRHETEAC